MGTLERRAREKEETRTRILDAARELFAADGVEAVTMRAIAERIEYTPTAIYHHFKDKQALIAELVARDFGALGQAIGRIRLIDDPVERLRRLGLAYVDFGLGHPAHYRFMFMTPKEGLDYGAIHAGKNPEEDAYGMLRETVAVGIAAGRFRPEFTDVEELAQICWSAVHGLVSLHLAKGCDPWIDWRDARETARGLVDVLMRGIVRAEGLAAR